MLEGRVAPDAMLQTLLTALPKETDELTVQQMLGYTQSAFWRFTGADERSEIAPKIETVLRAGLDAATSTSPGRLLLRDSQHGHDAATVEWLERVWRRDIKVPGLTFAEADESDMALDLAVRDVAAAEEILDAARPLSKNPDRKARFAFVMPALSATRPSASVSSRV